MAVSSRSGNAAVLTRSAEPLVARTGRKLQRYDEGMRLLAGCIPYRIVGGRERDRDAECATDDARTILEDSRRVEVLLISSSRGKGLVFPKGGWENDETAEEAAKREAMEEAGVLGVLEGRLGPYSFESQRAARSPECPEGLCRAIVFGLLVTEELSDWPEMQRRHREWLSIDRAMEVCRHDWMRSALLDWVHLIKRTAAAPADAGSNRSSGSSSSSDDGNSIHGSNGVSGNSCA